MTSKSPFHPLTPLCDFLILFPQLDHIFVTSNLTYQAPPKSLTLENVPKAILEERGTRRTMSVLPHETIIQEPRKVFTREVLLSCESLGEPCEVLLSSLDITG